VHGWSPYPIPEARRAWKNLASWIRIRVGARLEELGELAGLEGEHLVQALHGRHDLHAPVVQHRAHAAQQLLQVALHHFHLRAGGRQADLALLPPASLNATAASWAWLRTVCMDRDVCARPRPGASVRPSDTTVQHRAHCAGVTAAGGAPLCDGGSGSQGMRPRRAHDGRRGPRLVALGEASGSNARGIAVGGQRLHELRELAARTGVILRTRRGAHLRAGAPAGGVRVAGSPRREAARGARDGGARWAAPRRARSARRGARWAAPRRRQSARRGSSSGAAPPPAAGS